MKKIREIVMFSAALFTLIFIAAIANNDKPVIVHGQTYYKCSSLKETTIDTLFNPGGFTIIKNQTSTVYYDHWKMDGCK